jgi:hypothetical protein
VPEEQRKAFLNGLTLEWIPSSIDDIDLPFVQAYVIRQAIRELPQILKTFKELKKEGLVDLPGVIENLVLDYVSPYFDSSDSLISSVITKCIERLAAPTENKEAMMLESAEPMMLEGESKADSDIPNYVVLFHKKRSELDTEREKYEENEDMVYELISEVVSEVRAASEKFASAFNNTNASSQGSEAGDENTTPMEDDDQTNSSMKPTSAQSLNKNSQSNSMGS